jgi:hypothetical protein
MTRTVGIILIIVAVGALVIGGALLAAGLAAGSLQPAGAVLGFALLFLILVAPLGGGGIAVLVRSRSEQAEQVEADALRKILDMVKTRGQVDISDIVIELQSGLPAVKDMVYKLVGMGVFSGYVNWDEGVLYSAEVSALRDTTQCKHCGGAVTLAGKGVLKCPFCGTEYFLPQ